VLHERHVCLTPSEAGTAPAPLNASKISATFAWQPPQPVPRASRRDSLDAIESVRAERIFDGANIHILA